MSVETFSPLVATPPTAEARPGATGAHGHDDVAEHGPTSGHARGAAGHHRPQLHGHAAHAAQVGPSMLRLSLAARLAVAALLLLPLWVAVMLVTE
ncbi:MULTISPECIES: hypothetical protein [unclassified Xanthobacter]|uniref:hypothetical protein n=1 Tax=unclassified Xanthobacter TaxID=2623496 RepID=UPI001EDFDF1A|nr:MULTISPECIES: hypothetical protein [unclassified Xanthobacter]